MTRRARVIVLALAFGCVSAAAAAQQETDPSEAARFRLGPLHFTPSIALTNVGVDNNVFNDADNPRQDTVGALGPTVDLWLKAGPSRLSGKVSGQYLYFSKYGNQRAFNTTDEGKWTVPLAHLTPFLEAKYANTRDRPGYEIDSRARRRDDSLGVGTDIVFSSKTSLTLVAKRARFTFDRDETFLGQALATSLNRTSDEADLKLRYKLTPLTTFALNFDGERDRFTLEPLRNADSVRAMAGFEMKPFALISGSALVGVRRFTTIDRDLPDYQGLVAAVDAVYTVAATRIAVKANRDVAYSYEVTEPYYALTDLGVTLTQRIARSWDVVLRGGRQTLAYRSLLSLAREDDRIDHGLLGGAGIGYRVGQTLRIGFDANYYQRRSSSLAQHDYDGIRAGASFTYGLPQ